MNRQFIPLSIEEAKERYFNDNKSVLILYDDGTEAYLDVNDENEFQKYVDKELKFAYEKEKKKPTVQEIRRNNPSLFMLGLVCILQNGIKTISAITENEEKELYENWEQNKNTILPEKEIYEVAKAISQCDIDDIIEAIDTEKYKILARNAIILGDLQENYGLEEMADELGFDPDELGEII